MPLTVDRHVTGPLRENTWIAVDATRGEGLVVDPGLGAETLWRPYAEDGVVLRGVVLTHGHFDHVLGLTTLVETAASPVYMCPDDTFLLDRHVEDAGRWGLTVRRPPVPDRELRDGDRISVGDAALEVIRTPGHTPGSVCLRWSEGLFTGDTLLRRSVAIADPGSAADPPRLERSIRERLFTLPDELVVFPGHGQTTTIGEEVRFNPHVL